MNRNFPSLILTLLLLAASNSGNTVFAQADSTRQILFNQIYAAAEEEYGIHQELINGSVFEDKNQAILGHPYLLDYFSDRGSLVYRGKRYSNLSLRYDIYDQKVLLTSSHKNQIFRLYLHNDFITGFTVDNKKFIYEALGTDAEAGIYQVFGEDLPVRIVYSLEKVPVQIYSGTADKRNFEQRKETFVLDINGLVSYKGNGSFARKFASHNKSDIKKYLRKNKIKIQYATDQKMEQLIEYINSLEAQE